MAIVPLQIARVSNNLRSGLVSSALTRTQAQLLRVQNELTTGKRINSPSDAPGDSAIVQQVRKTLEQRLAFERNIKQASGQLAEVDSTLGDLTGLLAEAQSIASANVGSDVTADQRNSTAAIIDSIYSQALSLANKQFNGMYLFGGDRSTLPPFEEQSGGVRFVGSGTVLRNLYDENAILPFQVSGADIFGGYSTRVEGTADLTPNLAASTRLVDLAGATGDGVRGGLVRISNGIDPSVTLDLSGANSIADVINQINNAGLGLTATVSGTGLQIAGGGGSNITIADLGGGSMARDLGIAVSAGGSNVVGGNTQPKLTVFTPLSAMNGGSGIDTTGLILSNGTISETISLAGVTTVGDLINRINASTTGAQAEINRAGTGINIFNPTQGVTLSIGEAGGTTATDLGVRSVAGNTPLSVLNGGAGLRTADGNDLRLVDSAGNAVEVDLNGLSTIQDVITALNTAAGGAGVGMTVSLAANGNGLVITDPAGGPGSPGVGSLNGSYAREDLGLDVPATGAVITGRDPAPVEASGIFAHLNRLRNALRASDQREITTAAERLKTDYDNVIRVRGSSAALVQELESRQERLADQNIATKAMLSELEDTDYTEAIIRFQTLQTSLEASLKASSTMLQTSLMDFLR